MKTTQILLVSSEQEIRAWLEDAGFAVQTVANAADALQALDENSFGLLISDLVIGVSSGLDLLKKALSRQTHLKTMILAKQATLNSVLQAIHLHVNEYLLKPWSSEQLIHAVQDLLQNIKTAAPAPKERINSLLEITSILYQVNNMELAGQMILEIYTEFLGIPAVAIAMPAGDDGQFQVTYSAHLPDAYTDQIVFDLRKSINGRHISPDEPSFLSIEMLTETHVLPFAPEPVSGQTVQFYPVKFQEKLAAFILLFAEPKNEADEEQTHLLQLMAQLIGPVLTSLNVNKKSGNSYENIISKIVKDRIHEARLMLNPVSFAVLRIVYRDQFVDSLVLEDAIRQYQAKFHNKFEGKGDLIWLTADTAFVILPFMDLFTAESLATELTEDIGQICVHEGSKASFELKYACISYPQSGESAQEIINNLWLRLFEAIYFMQS